MDNKNSSLLDNLCRTCMNDNGEDSVEVESTKRKAFSIFNVPESIACQNITILELLMLTTPQLNIESGDMLPKTLCKTCLDSLINAYKFQKMCIRVEQILRQKIKEETTEDSFTNKDPLNDIVMDMSTEYVAVAQDVNNLNNVIKIEMDGFLIEQNLATDCSKSDIEVSEDLELDVEDNREDVSISNEDSRDVDWEMDSDWEVPLSNVKSKSSKVVITQIKDKVNDCSEKPKSSKENDIKKERQKGQLTDESTKNACDTKDSINKKFVCDECGDRLATCKSLKQHKLIHLRSVKAEELSSEVTNKSKRENERIASNTKDCGSKNFVCDECGKRLSSRQCWTRHKKIHLRPIGEKQRNTLVKKKHECEFCKKVFQKPFSLREHMRKHTGELPYLCSECGKVFSSKSCLHQHFLRHSTDRPLECPHCPKRFRCFSNLSSHIAFHKNVRPHVCDLCGSAFVKPYQLKRHKLIHTGEKKHKCDYCEKRFVAANNCQRHMRTHTGEKPYKCKYCERAYGQNVELVQHLRGHIGDNVYRCDLCPQAFRLQIDLRAHFCTHKDDDEETKARNLQALKEEEQRLEIKFGLVRHT